MTNQPKRLALLYLAVVFLVGAVFGFAAHRFYEAQIAGAESPPPVKEYRERLIHKLTQKLDLTPEQARQLGPILDDIGKMHREFWAEAEPRLDAIRAERARRIMGILNPEQRAKYEQILEDRRRRKEKKKGHDGCH